MNYQNNGIGEEDFSRVIKAYKKYLKHLESENNDNYIVNDDQYRKLLRAVGFFSDKVDNPDSIEIEASEPKSLHCGITVYGLLFDFYGDAIEQFADVIRGASAISIDATLDGEACISMTIPNVWVHK